MSYKPFITKALRGTGEVVAPFGRLASPVPHANRYVPRIKNGNIIINIVFNLRCILLFSNVHCGK
jgi:hypothetical protein